MILSAEGLTVRYAGAAAPALDRVSLSLAAGELVAVVGPNGSGKTTLLRALLGAVQSESGVARVRNRPVAQWPRQELARVIGVITQREEPAFSLTVRDSVLLGRYPHLGPIAAPRERDRQAIERAMRRADVMELADRHIETLSGGEWQRTRVARALAQEPEALVLDEPTAALDVRHEMEVFELIRELVTGGLAALVVTHHLNLAARYADRMLLLEQGRVAAEGRPTDVLTEPVVARVFDWPVAVAQWLDGSPQVVPLRPAESRP
jgi:iron complex transport system ATP-binding protein